MISDAKTVQVSVKLSQDQILMLYSALETQALVAKENQDPNWKQWISLIGEIFVVVPQKPPERGTK